MCKKKADFLRLLGPLTGLWVATALLLGSNQASAHLSPVTCTANNLSVNISKDKNNIKNGDTVVFTITVENPSTASTCDLTLGPAGLIFNCPGPTGNADGTQTILIGGNTLLPGGGIGTGVLTFTVPCVVSVTGTTSAQACVTAPGALLHDNTLQDDPASVSKCLSVNVFHPCIAVTKACVLPQAGCFEYGTPVTVSGVVTNCGDVVLTGVTVVDNHAGTVLSLPSLAAHTSAPYTGTYTPTDNLCGPLTDTVTATGTAPFDVPQVVGPATASASCPVCNNPCVSVTKNCADVPATSTAGGSYTVSGHADNCGNVPLQGVTVTDIVTLKVNGQPDQVLTVPVVSNQTIAKGGTLPLSVTINIPANFCGTITDQFHVVANSICGGAAAPANSAICTTSVPCPPCITVVKEVACAPANTGTCDGTLNYGKSATGVSDTKDPAFCYRITVTNPAGSAGFETCADSLQNVVVNDPLLGGVLAGFKSTLAPGESTVAYFQKTWGVSGSPHLNTVTATAVGVLSGQPVSVTDTATVTVLNIGVSCQLALSSTFDLDNNPTDNKVTLPADSLPGTPVQVSLTINNTGSADMIVTSVSGLGSLVDCDTLLPVNLATVLGLPLTVSKQAGSVTIPLVGCWLVTCPGGTLSVAVTAVADAKGGTLCVYDSTGAIISETSSPCEATVICLIPETCRVTGGGVLLPDEVETGDCSPTVEGDNWSITTTVFGPTCNGVDAVKITHGGQLGAPYARTTCGPVALNPLGDPCIRGQWEHVRHYKGKANPKSYVEVDNFHSNTPKGIFDSLQCACLPCCENPEAGGKPGNVCNPDDHKICGPMPRPAPANAIIFSGIGYLRTCASANQKGKGGSEPVIFRVYIEDRSEPGGQHPGGSKKPADVYCFQAWSLATVVGNSSGKIDSAEAIAARQLVADDNCAFIKSYVQGNLPDSSILGAALINDCGALHTGNQQIHPSTSATCTEPVTPQ